MTTVGMIVLVIFMMVGEMRALAIMAPVWVQEYVVHTQMNVTRISQQEVAFEKSDWGNKFGTPHSSRRVRLPPG